jgi:hypothetical protein
LWQLSRTERTSVPFVGLKRNQAAGPILTV